MGGIESEKEREKEKRKKKKEKRKKTLVTAADTPITMTTLPYDRTAAKRWALRSYRETSSPLWHAINIRKPLKAW